MSVTAMAWAWKQPTSSSGQRLVLLALADACNDHYEDGQQSCWPSVRRLSEYTHLSDSVIRGHLDSLVHAGLIDKVKRRRRADGSLSTWTYVLNLDHRLPVSGGDESYRLPVGGATACESAVDHRLPVGARNRNTRTVSEPVPYGATADGGTPGEQQTLLPDDDYAPDPAPKPPEVEIAVAHYNRVTEQQGRRPKAWNVGHIIGLVKPFLYGPDPYTPEQVSDALWRSHLAGVTNPTRARLEDALTNRQPTRPATARDQRQAATAAVLADLRQRAARPIIDTTANDRSAS